MTNDWKEEEEVRRKFYGSFGVEIYEGQLRVLSVSKSSEVIFTYGYSFDET